MSSEELINHEFVQRWREKVEAHSKSELSPRMLIAILSYDIRNNITTILGYSDVMWAQLTDPADQPSAEDYKDYLQQIATSADVIQKLISWSLEVTMYHKDDPCWNDKVQE
jgi:signal transduction histidine kinase